MNWPRILYYYLWVAPHVLLLLVAWMMLRRQIHKEYPLFFTYVLYEFAQFCVFFTLAFLSLSGEQYANWWLLGAGISTAVRFGVIHEVYESVFRTYPALAQLGRVLFRWATVVLLLIAIAAAVLKTGDGASRIVSAIYFSGRTVSIVQGGLLVLLFIFSRYFGLSWRSFVFGTALGLGIFASVDLAISAFNSQTGSRYIYAAQLFSMATYHFSVGTWIYYLLQREPVRKMKSPPPTDLQDWNNELERLLQQ